MFFKNIMSRTRFWNIKIRKDFPHCEFDLSTVNEEENYFLVRNLYWDIMRLNHVCNICRICCIENVHEDIPDYEWASYLD